MCIKLIYIRGSFWFTNKKIYIYFKKFIEELEFVELPIQVKNLRLYILHDDRLMIARNIIVSFYIFNLPKYGRIFRKNWSMTLSLTNKVLDQALCGGHYQVFSLKFMLVFFL